MGHPRRLLSLLLPLITACGGGDSPPDDPTEPPPPPPPPAAVATVEVTPGSVTLVPQQTTTFTATTRDASGATLTGRTITWSSSTVTVATVSNGLVTAVGAGFATITASSEGKSDTAVLTINNGGFVGPTGGGADGGDGAVHITVPAGALAAGTALTITPLVAPPPHSRLVTGSAYTLGPEGTIFARPVTVAITWAEGQLPAGTIAQNVQVHRYNGSVWLPLADAQTDLATRTATGTTTALSPFALIEISIDNPAPLPVQITPDLVLAGAPAFTLTVTGTGFLASSIVLWNGAERPTSFVSSTELTAEIPASDLASSGTADVTVVSPAPGGGTSVPLDFTVAPLTRNVLSLGGEHACALSATMDAYCWGRNLNGQLGTGTDRFEAVELLPVPVAGGLTFSSLSSNGEHSCAIAVTGGARCWGSNRFGQLGTGTLSDHSVPTPVAGPTLAAVSAGWTYSCGLSAVGAAYCWGTGGPHLGNGGGASSIVSVAVAGGLSFSSIVAGRGHTCGISTSGAGFCWGQGGVGQLGDGTTTLEQFTPVAVVGGHLFTTIGVGSAHSCALDVAGAAYCWGSGTGGQLGDGVSGGAHTRTAPYPVAGGLTFNAITAGATHTCGLTGAGTAYCWGYGAFGQLGNGTLSSSDTPVMVAGGLTFASIDAGIQNTCGTTTGGAGYCWGLSAYGLLGDGVYADHTSPTPTLMVGGNLFASVRPGWYHSCGLTVNGIVLCWGWGENGELGNGATSNRDSPTRLQSSQAFASISAGTAHSCGVTYTGDAWCWGWNAEGQLGDGSKTDTPTPVQVVGGHSFTTVATGTAHTCALTADWKAWCWGAGGAGQLGDGSSGVSAGSGTPVAVAGQQAFASITVGEGHSCALTATGIAYCWGTGGQVGAGNNTTHALPTAVEGNLSFVAITAGRFHTCGIATTGAAYCWGAGTVGRLGNGATANTSSPVMVSGAHEFTAITAGDAHSCGVTAAGAALCWGQGFNGQLGTGNKVQSWTPVPVVGGQTFRSIVAAGSANIIHGTDVLLGDNALFGSTASTCGLTFSGEIYCWGLGLNGRLGAGTSVTSLIPVRVTGGIAYRRAPF